MNDIGGNVVKLGLRYIKILHVVVLVAYLSGVGLLLQYLLSPPIQVALASDPAAYDLATSSNWVARYDGSSDYGDMGYNAQVITGDINNNGIDDLVIEEGGYNDYAGAAYVVFDTSYKDLTSTGNTFGLDTGSSFNIRYNPPAGNCCFPGSMALGDIDNDGKLDLFLSDYRADFNSRSNSGSVYVMKNALLNSYSGTGNDISLGTSSNYNIRIDGPAAGTFLGGAQNVYLGDYNNDSKDDIFIGSQSSNNSRSSSGSVYIINNDIVSGSTGTGNTLDLATSTNYSLRFDGSAAGEQLAGEYGAIHTADLNNNNIPDIVIGEQNATVGANDYAGKVYVIFDSLFSGYSGTGNNIDLATSTNYNISYAGTGGSQQLGNHMFVGDLDGDNKNDLGLHWQSVRYIISNTILNTNTGTGNSVNLATSTNYWLRVHGGAGTANVQTGFGSLYDITNDGKNDLVLASAYEDNNSRTNSGSVFVVSGSTLQSYTGSGNSFNFTNSANYIYRYDGAVESDFFGYNGVVSGDLNGDGSLDLLALAPFAATDSHTENGALFLLYTFPHTISLNSLAGTTSTDAISVSGSVTATGSASSVANVEYSVDTATFSGTWTSCSASDGSFNSTSEAFSCSVTLPSEGSHTIRVRAKDSNGVYTAVSEYASASTTYSAAAESTPTPTPTPSPTPTETATPTPTPTPTPIPSKRLTITKIGSTTLSESFNTFTYYGSFPTFTGTSADNASITIKGKSADGSEKTLCSTTASGSGDWQCKSVELGAGDYDVTLSATKDGNTSSARPFILKVVDESLQPASQENTSTPESSESSSETITSKSQSARVELTTTPTGEKAVSTLSMLITDRTGKPLANQSVTLASNPQTVTTDSKGIARFVNVPVGRHELSYVTPDNQKVAVGLNISVAQTNGTPTALTLEVQPITVPLPFFNSKWQPWIALILLLPAFGFMVWIVYKELQARHVES